jgi:hypothetical protein
METSKFLHCERIMGPNIYLKRHILILQREYHQSKYVYKVIIVHSQCVSMKNKDEKKIFEW